MLVALDPNNVNAYASLGAMLDKCGDYDRALEAYRQALALQPEHHFSRGKIGMVYAHL